ncbi:hypothetical protein [Streptomyces graminilatus]|uniref:hypothetical protein n=1 Tax=Streptomyces graminilatus TaxID=1464070 RepID=UPI0012FEF5AB|nr:hypothetical protein [Streptomyces graminilatus]
MDLVMALVLELMLELVLELVRAGPDVRPGAGAAERPVTDTATGPLRGARPPVLMRPG